MCVCERVRDGCDQFNSWLSDLIILVPFNTDEHATDTVA